MTLLIVVLLISIIEIITTQNIFDSLSTDVDNYPINSLVSKGSLFPFGGTIPSVRIHQSVTITTNFVTVYGGYSIDGEILGDTHLYHIPSQRWSGPISVKECCEYSTKVVDTIGIDDGLQFPIKVGFAGDYPLARAEHGAVGIAEKTYIFGGLTREYGYVQDMYKLDAENVKWEVVDRTKGNIPSRRAGHSMIADPTNNYIYLFGGRNKIGDNSNRGLNDVWRFDTVRDKWTLLNENIRGIDIPGHRQYASIAMYKNNMYMFGGIDPANNYTYNDFWVFRTGFQRWEKLFGTTGSNYGFSPPPLHSAHLLPLEEDGILVYGGVGGGGVCGGGQTSSCKPVERTIGQTYKFSISLGKFVAPYTINGDVSSTESTFVNRTDWIYSRLSSSLSVSQYVDRGKLFKAFVLEKLAYDPQRMIFFEFGGMQALSQQLVRNFQQSKLAEDGTSVELDFPIMLDSGGELSQSLNDQFTGEHLRAVLDVPTNAYWTYSDGLKSSQLNSVYTTDNITISNLTITFLRSFRIYKYSVKDIVLLTQESIE